MKKLLLVISFVAGVCLAASAQDIIRTKDGREIQAKILEVGTNTISYKRFSNPNGPTFTLAISQIKSIEYENGDNDVYSGSASSYTKKKYKELKKIYSKQDYKKTSGQPYSPFVAGLGSWFIPGLGQLYDGEGGRALGVFLGSCALGITTGVTYYNHLLDMQKWLEGQGHSLDEGDIDTSNLDYSTYPTGSAYKYFLMLGIDAIYNIWNIIDARKIAKIKDAYWQDCMGYSAVTLKLDPYFAFTPSSTGIQPVSGLSLKINF